MFGKKTAEDVLKLINALSDEEKARLMEHIGASEETASADDAGETPGEAAAETNAEGEATGEDHAEEDATPSEEAAESNEDPEKPTEEAPPAENDTRPDAEDADDAPSADDGAQALAALGKRVNALQTAFEERLASVEQFIADLKGEDDKQKGELGYQRMNDAKGEARESYLEWRKNTIGV